MMKMMKTNIYFVFKFSFLDIESLDTYLIKVFFTKVVQIYMKYIDLGKILKIYIIGISCACLYDLAMKISCGHERLNLFFFT